MHLQLRFPSCKIAIAELRVVIFVRNLTQKVDAVKLMEDFEADSVPLYPSFGVGGFQVRGGHADDFTLFIRNDLVTD